MEEVTVEFSKIGEYVYKTESNDISIDDIKRLVIKIFDNNQQNSMSVVIHHK